MIINVFDKATMADLFQQARAQGIDRPVLLDFAPGPQAKAVYTQLSGEPWKRKRGIPGPTSGVLAHTVGEAATALRNHAGLSGRLVANLIQSATADADGWYLALNADVIAVSPYWEGDDLTIGYVGYDPLPHCEVCSCCARKPGPLPLAVPVDGDIDLFLQVPEAAQVSRAIVLAMVAANRRMPTTLQPSDSLELPVGDGELVTILADFYSDSPQVVAEVLRALRREKHPGRKWLQQILRTNPALAKLAKKVDRLIGAVGK